MDTTAAPAPALQEALSRLRRVRTQRPTSPAGPEEVADWRETIAAALEDLARVLPIEEDQAQCRIEAAQARTQATRLRSQAPDTTPRTIRTVRPAT